MKKTEWFDYAPARQPSCGRIIAAAVGMVLLSGVGVAVEKGKAEHVVIMVWDGLRPDFITEQYTPTLRRLANQGVFFNRHHPVYISSTEVNGTALITGACPAHSTIVANNEYRPDIDRHKPIGTQDFDAVELGDKITGGLYLATPTLTELVQASGQRTAIAGTKNVALLLDRSQQRQSAAARTSVNFFKGQVLPPAAMANLVAANGGNPFPAEITFPNVTQDAWTTTALTQGMWKNGVPKFSVLWMSDPDYTQHNSSPGSPAALGALASADKNLAALLKALDEKGVREKTDVVVVSDHGFSTIGQRLDLVQLLEQAGFKAARKFDKPKRGEVLVVGLGGSVALYVVGHDKSVTRRLVEYLQGTDFAGVIFSRTSAKGTFPLSAVRLDSPGAPDLVVSLRWSGTTNEFNAPGVITYDGGKKNKGAHGSLSPYDMHNSLVAAGPDFRSGLVNELPSGNLDLAPTIVWILGLKPPAKMDGRVLAETFVNPPHAAPKAEEMTLDATRESAKFRWHQYLRQSRVGPVVYYDEGSGEAVTK
jgi:predicted AlkP superfamily pyrophosphatase or phosphodiesterase